MFFPPLLSLQVSVSQEVSICPIRSLTTTTKKQQEKETPVVVHTKRLPPRSPPGRAVTHMSGLQLLIFASVRFVFWNDFTVQHKTQWNKKCLLWRGCGHRRGGGGNLDRMLLSLSCCVNTCRSDGQLDPSSLRDLWRQRPF